MGKGLLLLAVVALPFAGCVDPDPDSPGRGSKGGISGSFYCESLTIFSGGQVQSDGPCDTNEPLILTQDGKVYWAGTPYGTYRLEGTRLAFIDDWQTGPVGWGRAQYVDDAITFETTERISVWRLGGPDE